MFETPIESVKTPEWELLIDDKSIDPELIEVCQTFELKFSLDLLVTGKAIDLRVSPEKINLQVGRFYAISLWMPFHMSVESLKSTFDCQTRKLSISGAVLSKNQDLKEIDLVEEPKIVLKPLELSSNDLLYDIV